MRTLSLAIIVLLFSCESYSPRYMLADFYNSQIRAYAYSDGCCGCNALVLHAWLSETVEYRYWVECNCGFGVSKQITTNLDKKRQRVEIYESSTADTLSLDSMDLQLFKKSDPAFDLKFGHCDAIRDTIQSITGFVKTREYVRKREKSVFRKKVKF